MSYTTARSILDGIAAAMRGVGPPPPFDEFRFGSTQFIPSRLREAKPRDPRVSVPKAFGGIPFRIDPNIPPYLAYMVGPDRGLFKTREFAVLDLRRRPQTDDMVQMLDDLRRFNAVPRP